MEGIEDNNLMNEKPFLGLGTVQMAMPYGVANRTGTPSEKEALAILKEARKGGVSFLDTAADYGRGEAMLGSLFRKQEQTWLPDFMSKLPPMPEDIHKPLFIKENIREKARLSLNYLGISSIKYYLLHRAADLIKDGVTEALRELIDSGIVGETGVSVYEMNEALMALREGQKVLQAPANIFDQRFLEPGFLKHCSMQGVNIFVRSIFLQGLFFLHPDRLPAGLAISRPYLDKLRNISSKENLSIGEIAIGFLKKMPGITGIIFGAESSTQVRETCRIYNQVDLSARVVDELRDSFNDVPRDISDPRKW